MKQIVAGQATSGWSAAEKAVIDVIRRESPLMVT